MTADMEANKKLSPIVIELFIKGRKFNMLLVFTSKSYRENTEQNRTPTSSIKPFI